MMESAAHGFSSPRRDAWEAGWADGRERLASALDALLGDRSLASWLEEYEGSHQHPFNKWLHLAGIPAIAASLPLALLALFLPRLWRLPAALFSFGLVAQLAGHAVEGRAPEFFKNWRFLLVGLRWWLARVSGGVRP